MSSALLARLSATAQRCALCRQSLRPGEPTIDIGRTLHTSCYLGALPELIEPESRPGGGVRHQHHAPGRRKTPPVRLYCLQRCQRMQRVYLDELGRYACEGCRRVLWDPRGRQSPSAPAIELCPVVWHVGDFDSDGAPVCLTCAGIYPARGAQEGFV